MYTRRYWRFWEPNWGDWREEAQFRNSSLTWGKQRIESSNTGASWINFRNGKDFHKGKIWIWVWAGKNKMDKMG